MKRICIGNSWVVLVVSEASEKTRNGENNNENNGNNSHNSVIMPAGLGGIKKKRGR